MPEPAEKKIEEDIIEDEEGKKEEEEKDERDVQILELQKELSGYKNKEYNFKKLRDMTEDERGDLTEREIEVKKRLEDIEEREETHRSRVVEGHKKDAFAVLAGDDPDLIKKMELHYSRINDDAITQDEINKKAKDAYLLATGGMNNGIDPIAKAAAYQSGRGATTNAQKLSADHLDLASRLGLSGDDIKKYSK